MYRKEELTFLITMRKISDRAQGYACVKITIGHRLIVHIATPKYILCINKIIYTFCVIDDMFRRRFLLNNIEINTLKF